MVEPSAGPVPRTTISGRMSRTLLRLASVLDPETARQYSPMTPDSWHQDKRIIPGPEKPVGSGMGFVFSPYSSATTKMWGVQPIKDLDTYLEMYRTVPVVRRAIDKTAMLAVSKGFEHTIDPDNPQGDEILKACDDFWEQTQINKIEWLTTVAKDLLIFGYSTSEKVYTDLEYKDITDVYGWPRKMVVAKGDLWGLKPLDPRWMRVQADAYGNVFGYIQYLITPPQIFTPEKMAFFKYSPWSIAYEGTYGTSQLMALIRTQDLIWQMENDLTVMAHSGAKPPVWYKCGTAEAPHSDNQITTLYSTTANRGAGSDIYTPGDVTGDPLPQPATMVQGLIEYLRYLSDLRITLLGVPPQLLGIPEGSSRTTADVSMDDFLITLEALQMSIAEGIRDQIYTDYLEKKFGPGVEIPGIVFNQIFERDKDKLSFRELALFDAGLKSKNEVRETLGLPKIENDPEADKVGLPPVVDPMVIPKMGPAKETGLSASRGEKAPDDRPTAFQKSVRVALLGKHEGIRFYLVDHRRVSELFDVRWTDKDHPVIGNHSWGKIGWYIPKDEIWISDTVPESERQGLMFHEWVEMHLMKGGVDYEKAHEIALTEQDKFRPDQIFATRRR